MGLTHQAMHDAHAVGVHCERLLVQLLGLLQAALHLGQPAPHVEYRVRRGEEARGLLDAEACFLEVLLLHEQLGCETRRAGEAVGEVRGSGPLPHPTISPRSLGAGLG